MIAWYAKRCAMLVDMAEPSLEDQLREVVAEVLGEVGTDLEHLKRAGRVLADRQKAMHRLMHAERQRCGAIVKGLREAGLTWRQIYDDTGMVQRTADVWQQLFLEEGITPRPDGELDARLQGEDREE